MRRGVEHSPKSTWDFGQIVDSSLLKAPTVNTPGLLRSKKLKKLKDFEHETHCHSARNEYRESETQKETVRTRSASPKSHVSQVEGKLPLKKFFKIYSKIVIQLETVKTLAEATRNECQNLVDLRRQLQRADEFSIRFSRNNLYDTKRIINEIKQLIIPYPFENLSRADIRTICKKIILAYQSASQSLQTYINYVKNPYNLEVPDKINELVLLVADLFLYCKHVPFPTNGDNIKNDSVKVCNELMTLLKSKLPVCEYVELKEEALAKKKSKTTATGDSEKTKKLSMYQPKFTSKLKGEAPKKKIGVPCLLGARAKKSKKDSKKVKITHEIYTQKLNHWQGKGPGSKNVKFKPGSEEKVDNIPEKKLRRPRYVTPREVKSQDDDVETVVQTIGDDDVSINRIDSSPREVNRVKTNLKELLLEAIEGLQSTDKKDHKIALNQILTTIQNCPKISNQNERVKVFQFKSKDLLEEMQNQNGKHTANKETLDLIPIQEKQIDPEEVRAKQGRSKSLFKQLRGKNKIEKGMTTGKVKLKLSEETMNNANIYKKAFAEYRKNNIMYKKTLANKPWELVGKVSDRIILDLIKEISLDFQNDTILRRLYFSELLEVAS